MLDLYPLELFGRKKCTRCVNIICWNFLVNMYRFLSNKIKEYCRDIKIEIFKSHLSGSQHISVSISSIIYAGLDLVVN